METLDLNTTNDNKDVIDETIVSEFDKVMENLGFSPDNSPIHSEKDKDIPIQINYLLEDNSAMGVYFYIVPWHNKRSYLYNIFLKEYLYGNTELEAMIKSHADHLRYEEKTRLGGIGWEVVYTKQPSEFTFSERKRVLFDIFKKGMEYLTNGLEKYDSNYKPRPGDVLISRPLGPKLNEGFTETSIITGSIQRGKIAQRYGFGEVSSNYHQYARYNNDLKLEPL